MALAKELTSMFARDWRWFGGRDRDSPARVRKIRELRDISPDISEDYQNLLRALTTSVYTLSGDHSLTSLDKASLTINFPFREALIKPLNVVAGVVGGGKRCLFCPISWCSGKLSL